MNAYSATALLAEMAGGTLDLAPRRYGLVAACDGGLLEVSGLSVPVGALCRVSHGDGSSLEAEAIGFRNGRTLMMLLGDTVMLRPGAKVRPQGTPGMLAVGEVSTTMVVVMVKVVLVAGVVKEET